MKIAVAGKGGVGKTTIAGTLARIFSERGFRIIAVDSDPAMNLHISLGLQRPRPVFEFKDLVKRVVLAPGVYSLNPEVKDIPERCSSREGNLMLLVMGTVEKAGEGCVCPESSFLRALIRHLVLHRKELLILDTGAGLEHLGRGVAENFDLMLVVAEPSVKAVEAANKIMGLSREMGVKRICCVGNKTRNRDDEEFIRKKIKNVIGFIPYDEAVIQADKEGKPLSSISNSRALRAVEKLADKIKGR